MAKLRDHASDLDLENQGVWVPWRAGIQLRIARAGRKAHNECVQRLGRAHRGLIRMDTPEARAKVTEVTHRAAAESLLLDWKNVEDDDGNPLPYTAEVGYRYLSDEAFRDLYEFVTVTANDATVYLQDLREDALGN